MSASPRVCSEDTKHAFVAAYAEWSIATEIYHGVAPPRTAAEMQKVYAERLLRITAKEMQLMRDRCRAEFGSSRGWTWKRPTHAVDCAIRQAGFPGWGFGPCLDHADVYYAGRKLAALVTHAYAPIAAIQVFADEYRLTCEPLDFSWYWPGGTTAAVLMPRARVR